MVAFFLKMAARVVSKTQEVEIRKREGLTV